MLGEFGLFLHFIFHGFILDGLRTARELKTLSTSPTDSCARLCDARLLLIFMLIHASNTLSSHLQRRRRFRQRKRRHRANNQRLRIAPERRLQNACEFGIAKIDEILPAIFPTTQTNISFSTISNSILANAY
jgi:hypothetical protein